MSAHEMGKAGPMSRRNFLNAAALATVAGVVGCAGGADEGYQAKEDAAVLAEAEKRKNQPIITWAEAAAAVQAFYQEKLLDVPIETITGVALLTWDHGPQPKFIEVRWREKKPQVPFEFEYVNPNDPEGKKERVRVKTQERDFLKATVKAGDSAKGSNVIGSGTAGWTIRYNNKNVCISAMHALCSRYNLTAIGTDVSLAGAANAKLHSFQPISWDSTVFNLWDIAMAEYDSGSVIESETMRQCGNGSNPPYPMKLSVDPTAAFSFKKVGAATPICRTGYLNGFGKTATLYSNGKIAYFDGQLLMSAMAADGDSGAALIWTKDNSVAGILHSADSTESVACPLFKAPLLPAAEPFQLGSGQIIPAFTSPAPSPPRCWI